MQPADLEAEIQQLGLFVGVDWSGRDAVSVTDASALVTGSARRTAWIREQVRRHVATGPLRELVARDRRLLNVLRTAELERRRECP